MRRLHKHLAFAWGFKMQSQDLAKDLVDTASLRRTYTRPPPKFRDTPFKYLEEVEGDIENLTNLGDGVLRINGWVVLVPHVAPGERVKAQVHSTYKTYSEAALVEVVRPSADRVEPICPLYGICGGCQYQHISIEAQRTWKRQQVVDCLTRIGGLKDVHVEPMFGTDEIYEYRSKITPHYDRPTDDGSLRAIGFRRTKFPAPFFNEDIESAEAGVVDVPRCEIARPNINAALPAARAAARAETARIAAATTVLPRGHSSKITGVKSTRQNGATLLLRESDCCGDGSGVETDQNAEVSQRVGGLEFRFRAGDFFQNNPLVLPHLVKYVAAQASLGGGCRYLIDAYCGGGLFCLSASSSFEQCAGVEIAAMAVESAQRNAALNGITNAKFVAGKAEAIFATIDFPGEETAVVIDPPRKGCDAGFLRQLFAFAPRRIVYVSCDPATQARDAKILVGGGYQIEAVRPFDLFPHTKAIECVITFVRDNAAADAAAAAAAEAATAIAETDVAASESAGAAADKEPPTADAQAQAAAAAAVAAAAAM